MTNDQLLITNDEKTNDKQATIIEKKMNSEVRITETEVNEKWVSLLTAVKPYNHSVEAFLRSARAKAVNQGILTVEVFYPFHKDKLEEPKNREIVEHGVKKVYGVDVILKCVLAKNKKEVLVIDNNTPMEEVTPVKDEIYDVAKEIFG